MEYQVEREDKSVQTDYEMVSRFDIVRSYQEEEELGRLEDGSIISYEFEDKFLQDYTNSYGIWKKDADRFIKDEFVDEFNKTGTIPVLKDGRPEMEQFFDYTMSTNAFDVYWGATKIFIKTFIEDMMKTYQEHGKVPEYLSSISQKIIALVEWNPPAD